MSIDMIGIPSLDLDRLAEVTRALAANAERHDRTADFPADGIHFTSVGYAHRGQMIAEALAEAFPAD